MAPHTAGQYDLPQPQASLLVEERVPYPALEGPFR